MCNCIAHRQIRVCTVTQKVTFQSPASSLRWEQPEPSRHQLHQGALLTAPLLRGEAWGTEPWWPLIPASCRLPPFAHMGTADWANSAQKVAAPFLPWLADRQHKQPYVVPPSSKALKQKNSALGIVCLHI